MIETKGSWLKMLRAGSKEDAKAYAYILPQTVMAVKDSLNRPGCCFVGLASQVFGADHKPSVEVAHTGEEVLDAVIDALPPMTSFAPPRELTDEEKQAMLEEEKAKTAALGEALAKGMAKGQKDSDRESWGQG